MDHRAATEIRVSDSPIDPDWDSFLRSVEGGHHAQSSLWAEVKATVGWSVLRVTASQSGRIVGGAQLLLRSIPVAGSVAYLPKGPIVASEAASVFPELMSAVHAAAKDRRVQLIAAQPPDNGAWIETHLQRGGYHPSPLGGFPTATVIVDLAKDLDDILGAMKSKTRYNVRLSGRKGMTVRVGTAEDVATFTSILQLTGERQDFNVNDEEYYANTARIFGVDDGFKLFLAEHDNEVASAMFAIAFGDTVLFKRGGWSGELGALRPNEAMHWAAIKWAKEAGYRYYNFEGIDADAARQHLSGEKLDSTQLNSVTRFKLGFGGDVQLLPGVLDRVNNPALGWGYHTLGPRLLNSAVVDRVLDFVRSR